MSVHVSIGSAGCKHVGGGCCKLFLVFILPIHGIHFSNSSCWSTEILMLKFIVKDNNNKHDVFTLTG